MRHLKPLAGRLLGFAVLAALAGFASVSLQKPAPERGPRGDGAVRTDALLQAAAKPNLDGGVGWINSGPIRLDELRGKVVLLDFWTYCCINCHHVLPDLAKLEEKYKNELVVIGVHSPKFYAERDTENIRRKVREYGIKHPVINDANQELWNKFGVQSWPTLVLLDTDGSYLGSLSGEGHYAILDKTIGALVAKHRTKGDLNETPVKFFPEIEKPDDTGLLFPGKVLADAAGKRLFIADTGHNRIVMTDLKGEGAKSIGNGAGGLVDGDYAKAEFQRPQGMCLVGETLYVADTENHAIRAVDLKARTVATVAGNGKQTHSLAAHGPGKTTSLTSPWDVIQVPGTQALLIAMAGQHQIWRFEIADGTVGVWAGTGREDIIDGRIGRAAFSQPSGLATDGVNLYVADSEVSALRAITLDPKSHVVRTIVGSGLFVFDDKDGVGDEVRLQHCLGVAFGNGRLYVADTYNNRIKECDPRTRTVKTLFGTHEPGDGDKPPQFYQPGGLSLAGTTLYVADTNNNKVRAIDLKAETVTTLDLEGVKPPVPPARAPNFPNATVVNVPSVKVEPGPAVTLDVALPLAAGFKLNADVAMPYLVEAPDQPGALAAGVSRTGAKIQEPTPRFTVQVDLARPAKAGETLRLKFSAKAFVCNEGSNLCQVKSYVWNVPITFAAGGKEKVALAAAPH